MTKRTRNFNAGPAALPLAALERAQAELVDFQGTGMSIMEHSHRGKAYEAVHQEALSLIRRLMGVPDDYAVLLLQGGARQQFAMVPMNLRPAGASADYTRTGNWAKAAYSEASLLGPTRLAGDTLIDGGYTRVPSADELDLDPEAAYLHLTSNNTLYGTQWHELPDTGAVPIVADMTSDLMSRRIDVSRYGLIYAGAQKNVGPAGVTVVILQKALLDAAREDQPEVFRYRAHAAKDSLWNTPPTFSIYMMRNTLAVLEERGGVEAMERHNADKAAKVYGLIDAHPDFFRCPVELGSRSLMNAVFRLPTEALEKRFIEEAAAASIVGVKGHRVVGGLRISMYNWAEAEWIDELCELMDGFRRAHG